MKILNKQIIGAHANAMPDIMEKKLVKTEERWFSTKKAAIEDRQEFRHLFKSNAEMDRAMPIKKYGTCDYSYSAPLEVK